MMAEQATEAGGRRGGPRSTDSKESLPTRPVVSLVALMVGPAKCCWTLGWELGS